MELKIKARIEAISKRIAYDSKYVRKLLDKLKNQNPKLLYRGFGIKLTDEEFEAVKRLLRMPMTRREIGQHLKIGELLIRKTVDKHGGIGIHWTSRYEMAKTAAYVRSNSPNTIAIVLTAEFDRKSVDYDPIDVSGLDTEDEIPLLAGKRIKIIDAELVGFSNAHVLRRPVFSVT